MEQIAESIRLAASTGRRAVVGRVIGLKGFSTLPVDELIAIDESGEFHGELLGRPGVEKLTPAGLGLLDGPPRLETVGVSIHGPQVQELGLSCGGQADVLLQPVSSIPGQFWGRLGERAPVALVTVIDGPGAGPEAVVVDRAGDWGDLVAGVGPDVRASLVEEARGLLSGGRTASRRVETDAGVALLEAWVPPPRLVVVGSGDILTAIEAQGALLGWETRSADQAGEVGELLDWAGATAALIVTSHDPHVDAPALAEALGRPVPYIGAMGSRGTQSRRLERLAAMGVPEPELNRIHRPIGLNLGGRRAAEVALAIVAEILAAHCGRDGRPLKETSGPIHG